MKDGERRFSANDPGWFRRFAHRTAEFVGCPACFFAAVMVIALWACIGPLFNFSDTWQLVINTATTIVTFLMVFLIQNTQNRDAKAIHLKLDELIKSMKGARNSLVALEELSDEELEKLQKQFERLRERSRNGGPGEENSMARKPRPKRQPSGRAQEWAQPPRDELLF